MNCLFARIERQILLVEVFLSVDHDRWGSQDARNGVDRLLFNLEQYAGLTFEINSPTKRY